MLDEDDGSNAGSNEPDEPAFSSIRLTPLVHHQQRAQQGEHTNTPLPSPAHILQTSSPVADHTHDRVASDGADESTENSSQNTGVGVPCSVSETSALTGCSGSANKAPTGSRGKAREVTYDLQSAEGLARLVAQGRALHPPTLPQRANAPVIPPPSSIASRVGDRAGYSTGRVNFQGIKPPKKNTLPQEWWLDSTRKALCAMIV